MITENLVVTDLDEMRERLVSPAPVLITEREVALSTAVALRARPASKRRWFETTRVRLSAVRLALAPSMQKVVQCAATTRSATPIWRTPAWRGRCPGFDVREGMIDLHPRRASFQD